LVKPNEIIVTVLVKKNKNMHSMYLESTTFGLAISVKLHANIS